MIHADYRGKGLFKKLVQFAMVDLKDCGFDFIFGFANNNSHPGFVKLNFETLYQINNYIKILNYQVVLQNKLTFLPFAKHIGKIVDKFKNQLAFSSKYNIISTNDLSEEITNFISSNISNKIFQKRDLGLLSWKYLQKPYSNYEILLIKKDKIIESVFFIRIEDDEMNSVTIMDYFIGNDKNLPKVLKEIIKYYRNKNKGYLQTWEIGSNLYINALHKNHLIKRNLELYFIIKPLKEDFDDFKNLNLWHITNSDSDTA